MTEQTNSSSIFRWIGLIVAFFAVIMVMKFVLGAVFKAILVAAFVAVVGSVIYKITQKSGTSAE